MIRPFSATPDGTPGAPGADTEADPDVADASSDHAPLPCADTARTLALRDPLTDCNHVLGDTRCRRAESND